MSDSSVLKGKKVLVADDECELREALTFDLKRRGFDVVSASNGKDAYDLLSSNQVDLILSDVRMPIWSGVQLLEKVQSDNPHPPVILLSGFTDITAEEAVHRGAQALINKPFDRKALHALVSKVLEEEARRKAG